MKMYNELAEWFHLLTDPSEYVEETATYGALIRAACPDATTLLELGSGGGNAASHLKEHFACTLTDISEGMLQLSQTINPECEHVQGDMRTLRLGRAFDVVFVHDAVVYMTTREDLTAAIDTAYLHTRPGGVAVFVPDATRESFVAGTDHGGGDGDDGRGIRYLEWSHEPEPGATTCLVDYVLVTRQPDGTVTTTHDRHVEGLFTRSTWEQLLTDAGFVVTTPELNPLVHEQQVAFVCLRPA
jgi:SAM-dependent methyltransferase